MGGFTMTPCLWRTALVVGLGLASLLVEAGEPKKVRGPRVKLGNIPDLQLVPRPPVSKKEAKRIKDLIASFANLDSPDFGLSPTLSGDAFAPLPGQSHAGTLLLTDHRLRRSQALKDLVALGPDALPFLLDALDDNTPTRVVIEHRGIGGAMWHAAELPLNPVNPAEQSTYKAQGGKSREKGERVKSYTVKVGDVCFVAIGQIVGRGYRAVRYQPTACIVVNSPVHDSNLCAAVRTIWTARDSRARLFNSLRADYATEGVFNGKSLDGWSAGSRFQCGAAMRLLFYYPKEAAPLVAGRLNDLDVGKDVGLDGYMLRCVDNRVRAEDFIRAIAWTRDPSVREALAGVFRNAQDDRALRAALPAIDDVELIRRRLESRVDALPAKEEGPYGQGYHYLLALGQRTPKTARAVFERYLRGASAQRCHTVCLVLREVKLKWDVALLGPLLADRRTWGWTYAVKPDSNEPRRPIRVCDEAAVTLSQNHPKLKFTQAGEHADLDRQIAAMRAQLAQKK
jgi:hypothetical protein